MSVDFTVLPSSSIQGTAPSVTRAQSKHSMTWRYLSTMLDVELT